MLICRSADALALHAYVTSAAMKGSMTSSIGISSLLRSFSSLSISASGSKPETLQHSLNQRSLFMVASSSSSMGSQTLNQKPLLGAVAPLIQPVRTRIMYSQRGGKAETVQDVVNRFFRLHNGLWIRPMQGRNRGKYRKTLSRVHRLQQHVVCNRTQCQMLDKMVEPYYRDRHHFVNDPYQPYHRLSNLPDYRYQPPKFLP